jgi:hypothetical protein
VYSTPLFVAAAEAASQSQSSSAPLFFQSAKRAIPPSPTSLAPQQVMAMSPVVPSLATVQLAPPKKKRGRPPSKKPEQCANCGTTQTPEWRRGELAPNKFFPLCNACGLQIAKKKKIEKDARTRGSIASVLNP